MNQYEECINSMWEEIEGKRFKAEGRRTGPLGRTEGSSLLLIWQRSRIV